MTAMLALPAAPPEWQHVETGLDECVSLPPWGPICWAWPDDPDTDGPTICLNCYDPVTRSR